MPPVWEAFFTKFWIPQLNTENQFLGFEVFLTHRIKQ